jgi:YfdX protein
MAKTRNAFLAVLGATTILATGAVWAADTAPMKEANATPQQAASKDLARFSADGAAAYENMLQTRRALYEGRTDDAKKFVALADAGFNKAKTDDTVYTKAEADLKAPTPKGGGAKTSPSADATPDAPTAMEKKPIAWVPIDGSITVMEDITGDAPKTAAVADANASLQKGDRDAAVQKLKVAGIEVAIVLAVMPIDTTIEKVHKAAELIDAGKYYEGGQELRMAQADERFDMVGNLGTPKE